MTPQRRSRRWSMAAWSRCSSTAARIVMPELSLFDLTGRLAVVTGCRRGIGLAMAEALAAAGADIIGVSAAQELQGSEVARRVSALDRAFTPYRVDLANRTEVAELAATLAGGPRPVDILV